MLPDPPTVFPVYLRTSATPLVPSTSIQSRSRSKIAGQSTGQAEPQIAAGSVAIRFDLGVFIGQDLKI